MIYPLTIVDSQTRNAYSRLNGEAINWIHWKIRPRVAAVAAGFEGEGTMN